MPADPDTNHGSTIAEVFFGPFIRTADKEDAAPPGSLVSPSNLGLCEHGNFHACPECAAGEGDT